MIVTEKSDDELLMVKTPTETESNTPGFEMMSATLSSSGLSKLWGVTVIDLDSPHMVNVKVGGAVLRCGYSWRCPGL